jgi:hypothetical protein
MLVDETTETEVHATPPTVAVAPVRNPAPVIVIPEPPTVLPEVGEIEVTVGGVGAVSRGETAYSGCDPAPKSINVIHDELVCMESPVLRIPEPS